MLNCFYIKNGVRVRANFMVNSYFEVSQNSQIPVVLQQLVTHSYYFPEGFFSKFLAAPFKFFLRPKVAYELVSFYIHNKRGSNLTVAL